MGAQKAGRMNGGQGRSLAGQGSDRTPRASFLHGAQLDGCATETQEALR